MGFGRTSRAREGGARDAKCKSRRPRWLLGLAVLVVLRNERPEVVDFLVVLDAGESHLGAGDLGLGIPDVFLELGLVPGYAGILVGVRVGITFGGAGLAAVEPVELGADLVLGALADCMAGQAFVERGLAGRGVLRQRRGGGGGRRDDDQRAQDQFFHDGALLGFRRRGGCRRCFRPGHSRWTSRISVFCYALRRGLSLTVRSIRACVVSALV